MALIRLLHDNVLTGRCLKRKIDDIEIVKKEVAIWQKAINNKNEKVNWQFTADDARRKLRCLYPALDSWRDIRRKILYDQQIF